MFPRLVSTSLPLSPRQRRASSFSVMVQGSWFYGPTPTGSIPGLILEARPLGNDVQEGAGGAPGPVHPPFPLRNGLLAGPHLLGHRPLGKPQVLPQLPDPLIRPGPFHGPILHGTV